MVLAPSLLERLREIEAAVRRGLGRVGLDAMLRTPEARAVADDAVAGPQLERLLHHASRRDLDKAEPRDRAQPDAPKGPDEHLIDRIRTLHPDGLPICLTMRYDSASGYDASHIDFLGAGDYLARLGKGTSGRKELASLLTRGDRAGYTTFAEKRGLKVGFDAARHGAAKATLNNNSEIPRWADVMAKSLNAVGVTRRGALGLGLATEMGAKNAIVDQTVGIAELVRGLTRRFPRPGPKGEAADALVWRVKRLSLHTHGYGGDHLQSERRNGRDGAIGVEDTAELAAGLAPVASAALAVSLYACSTAGKGEGGSESFAGALQEALVDAGVESAHVMGHVGAGHTVTNDGSRFFAQGTGSSGTAQVSAVVGPRSVFDAEFVAAELARAERDLAGEAGRLTIAQRARLTAKGGPLAREPGNRARTRGLGVVTAMHQFFFREATALMPTTPVADSKALTAAIRAQVQAAWRTRGYAESVPALLEPHRGRLGTARAPREVDPR